MIQDNPLVSICCIAYNQENYIRETLDGFLMQKTTFSFEIIVHDDASNDKTPNIIKEYADKYPDKFVTILQDENQWSKGGGSIFARFVFPRAKGKYIALCEGDDYWTDPLKLQKQVDFLEENQEYSLVHTNCTSKKYNNLITPLDLENVQDGYIFESLITHKFYISTLTVCVRRELLLEWVESNREDCIKGKWLMFDYPLWLEGSYSTKFKYLDEITACYRILPESASHSRNKFKRYLFYKSVYDIKFHFARKKELGLKPTHEIKIEYYKGLLNYSKYNIFESTKGLIYLLIHRLFNLKMLMVYVKNIIF